MNTTTKAPGVIGSIMQRALRAAGGGRVTLTLTEAGTYTAAVYLTREGARKTAVEALNLAGNPATSVERIKATVAAAEGVIIAYGRGKSPSVAFASLLVDIETRAAKAPSP